MSHRRKPQDKLALQLIRSILLVLGADLPCNNEKAPSG